MKRRDFIKNGTLATAAGIQILNFPIFGKAAPSNKVILAVMGVNLKLLPPQGQSYILAGALLSITINPLAFKLVSRFRPAPVG